MVDKQLMYIKEAKITTPEREGVGKREEKAKIQTWQWWQVTKALG